MIRSKRIVLIGAGNVATHLGLALQDKGFSIIQVFSHTLLSAERLGKRLNISFTNDIQAIRTDADIYLFAVKDSALTGLLDTLPPTRALFIHTAGSLPMDIFSGYSTRAGVLYPLQTFSRDREVDFNAIPLFIEANNEADGMLLQGIADSLSSRVFALSSEKRKDLHLAAVFACNFVNHMYAIASGIVESNQIPREVLFPLIDETAAKIKALHPREAQTGPAVRNDRNVIDKHLQMLDDTPWKELYALLSKSITDNS